MTDQNVPTAELVLQWIKQTGCPAVTLGRCPTPIVTALPDGRVVITLTSELVSTELMQVMSAYVPNLFVVEV